MGCARSVPIATPGKAVSIPNLTIENPLEMQEFEGPHVRLGSQETTSSQLGEEAEPGMSRPQLDAEVSRRRSLSEHRASSFASLFAALPDKRPSLTDDEKQTVASSWNSLRQDIGMIGLDCFLLLFERVSFAQQLFARFREVDSEQLKQSTALRDHGVKVLMVVERSIHLLDNQEELLRTLHDIGEYHTKICVSSSLMDIIGDVIITALRSVAKEWSVEVNDSWKRFFALITHIIKEAMPGDKPLLLRKLTSNISLYSRVED